MSSRRIPLPKLEGETEAEHIARLTADASASAIASTSASANPPLASVSADPPFKSEPDSSAFLDDSALQDNPDTQNNLGQSAIPVNMANTDQGLLSPGALAQVVEIVRQLTISTPSPPPAQRHREQSTAFADDYVYDSRRGKAAHPDFNPYPNNGANPMFNAKVKFRGKDPEKFGSDNNAKSIKFDKALASVSHRHKSDEHPFTNVTELVQTLENGFGNPLEKEKARAKLKTLKYHMGEDWAGFLTRYNSLFHISKGNRAKIKEDLLDHLDERVQCYLRTLARDPATTYESFCEYAGDHAYAEDKKIKAFRAARTDLGRQPKVTFASNSKPTSSSATTSTTPARRPTLTTFNNKGTTGASIQGDCWVCKKPGHRAVDYPDKPRNFALVELEDSEGDTVDDEDEDNNEDDNKEKN